MTPPLSPATLLAIEAILTVDGRVPQLVAAVHAERVASPATPDRAECPTMDTQVKSPRPVGTPVEG